MAHFLKIFFDTTEGMLAKQMLSASTSVDGAQLCVFLFDECEVSAALWSSLCRVMFKFKSSKKSNNGTDVNAGQIPQLLYR